MKKRKYPIFWVFLGAFIFSFILAAFASAVLTPFISLLVETSGGYVTKYGEEGYPVDLSNTVFAFSFIILSIILIYKFYQEKE